MLGLKRTLTFIICFIIIFWARINQEIFCAGKIMKTLNIRLEELLPMMGRCFIIVVNLELSDIVFIFLCACKIRKHAMDVSALLVILPTSMYLMIRCFMPCPIFVF